MSNIRVTLTYDQAEHTIMALQWSQDFENQGNSEHNAFIQRIINKIRKEMIRQSL